MDETGTKEDPSRGQVEDMGVDPPVEDNVPPGDEGQKEDKPDPPTSDVKQKNVPAKIEQSSEASGQDPEKSEEDWGADTDPSNISREERSLLGNMTYEEETELKKNTSIGAILSGLSTGSLGSDAKKNVVRVEDNTQGRRRFGNKRFRGDYGSGYGNNYNNYNNNYNNYSNYSNYNNYNNNYHNYNNWDEEPQEEEQIDYDQFIKEENQLLEQDFGVGVITVMLEEEHGVIYSCEICQSQMNARKGVDTHVNGMKHLKRKNVWDKKRRLENFAKPEEEPEKKEEEETKAPAMESKPSPNMMGQKQGNAINPSYPASQKQGGGGGYPAGPGYPSGAGYPAGPGYPGYGMQQPPYGQTMAMPQRTPAAASTYCPPAPKITPGHWDGNATAPTAPKPAEDKPKVKTSLAGNSTGTLLKKLAACAVKNFKDSDLATNVVISLVKAMKEYNHTTGDTKAIEVLTEMDVRLRGLKTQMASLLAEANKKAASATKDSKSNTSKASGKENLAKSNANPAQPANAVVSDSSQNYSYSDGSAGWYSQLASNILSTAASYSTQTPASYASQANNNYAYSYPAYNSTPTVAQDDSSYASNTASNYAQGSYNTTQSYTSQQGQAPTATANTAQGYAAQNYGATDYQKGYQGKNVGTSGGYY